MHISLIWDAFILNSGKKMDVISYHFAHFVHESVEIDLKWVIIAAFPICQSESVYILYHKPVQLLGYSKNCQTKNKQEQVSFTSSYVD
jgi:hypothetical protein